MEKLNGKSWSDIKVPPEKPKENEKKAEIDWLDEVERAKRECKIKTETPQIDYTKPIIRVNIYTETND